jgi:hypothetical protein
MAAGAGVAAVLVAGLQVSDFATISASSPIRQGIAVAAAGTALLLVLLTVARCARVLATPRHTIRDLASREKKAGGLSASPRLSPLSDPLVQAIIERRTHLLQGRSTISALYAEFIKASSATSPTDTSETASTGGREPSSTKQLERDVEHLEDWAQLLDAQRGFERLTRHFVAGSIAFSIAVLAYIVATQGEDASVRITKPLPVTVHLRVDPTEIGLSNSCHRDILSATAIGGTLAAPTLLFEGKSDCGPKIVSTDLGDVVVVPAG